MQRHAPQGRPVWAETLQTAHTAQALSEQQPEGGRRAPGMQPPTGAGVGGGRGQGGVLEGRHAVALQQQYAGSHRCAHVYAPLIE